MSSSASRSTKASDEASKIARYCSSRRRSASSAFFFSVMSRLHREDARHAADLDRLQPDLVPGDAAVGPAAAPLVGRTVALARELKIAARIGFGVGLVARAEDRERRAEHVIAVKARHLAGLGIEVDQRAGVPVVDDDAVLDRLEDRPVAFLRLPHRLVGAQTLDLGGGADGEDLHHRLDPVEVAQRRARRDRDQAEVRAGTVRQRIAGVAFDGVVVQRPVAGEELGGALRNDAKAVAQHAFAGRAGDRVRAAVDRRAVELHREHLHRAGLDVIGPGDEGDVDVQDLGERARQLGEDRAAERARDGERRRAQHALGRRSLELGRDPAADDLEHRLGQRDVGERRAIHDGEQAEAIALAVAERKRSVRVHAFRREQAARPGTRWPGR